MPNTWPYLTLLVKPIPRIQFFQELGKSTAFILILSDGEAALNLANGTELNHPSTNAKHIDIEYNAIRHYIQEDKIQVNRVAGPLANRYRL